MNESVQFWLDNKMSTGIRVASIGDQTLVSYRERYHIVVDGAALSRGGKAQQFSKTSLPAIWKKALRGILPAEPPPSKAEVAEILPRSTQAARDRRRPDAPEAPPLPVPAPAESSRHPDSPPAAANITAGRTSPPPRPKVPPREPVRAVQERVSATCPYCGCRHELELDKRKNGKPFFVTCTRCAADFGVRLVPVTVYQAQVAAFS